MEHKRQLTCDSLYEQKRKVKVVYVCVCEKEGERRRKKESSNSRRVGSRMATEEKSLADREKMKFPLPGGSSRRVRSSSRRRRRKYRFSWTTGSLFLFFFLSSFFKEDRRIRQSSTLLRYFRLYPDFKILIIRLFCESLRCYIFDARYGNAL